MEDVYQDYELEYIRDSDTSDEYTYDENGTRIQTFSISTAETEQSYEVLFTKHEAVEYLRFLSFEMKWIFASAICNLIVFVILTFIDTFIKDFKLSLVVFIVLFICYCVFLLDIISKMVHYWSPVIKKQCYKSKTLPVIIFDAIALLILILHIIPGLTGNLVLRYTVMGALIYKLHEIIEYYLVVSKMASKNTVMDMIRKYGMFYCVIIHVSVLIWYMIGCNDPSCEKNDNSWTKYIREDGMHIHKAQDWYFMCTYIVLSAFTSTGLGVSHGYNNLEAFFLTVIALLGLSIVNGIFLGACTSVQIETYRRHAEYSEKIKNIKTKLSSKKLPRSLRRKIMTYYITCWIQLGGVLKANHFAYLPKAISMQINDDTYVNALNASHLFRHSHEAIRRAIACKMVTEIFTQGEVMFLQGVPNNRMIYLARGSVQILSGIDEESPIMSLEMGSVIGELNLLLSIKSPVKVIASSYCVVNSINKIELWRLLTRYRKMKQNKNIRKILQAKIEFAHKSETKKRIAEAAESKTGSSLLNIKTLKKMKKKLIDKKKQCQTIDNVQGFDTIWDIYVVNKLTTVLRHTDEICLITSFPWILRPDSALLVIWDTFIVLLALSTGIAYPYLIGFQKTFASASTIYSYFVDVAFVTDVLLQLFTAVENDQGVHRTLGDIFAIKIRSFGFIMDLLSIFPLYFLTTLFSINCDERMYAVFQLNRIFKLYKIASYLSKLENSFKINVGVIRGVKYVLCYVFLSYLIGTVWYMESCFNFDSCTGWYAQLEKLDAAQGSERTKSPFFVALSFLMMVISQSGYGGVYATSKREMLFMIITNFFGVLTFTYLVADYSATLTLANDAFNQFSQMVHIIRKFMENNQLPDSLRNRTNEYLAAQWRYSSGLASHEFLTELPNYMFQEQRGARYAYLFEKCPLFKGMGIPFLSMLASSSTLELLPPNEMLKYAGEKTRHMYIIESGYCVVISAISGKQEKIIGPGGHIYDFEMVLEQTGIFNIKSLTHVSLLKLSMVELRNSMKYYPDFEKDMETVASEIKNSLAIQRIFVKSREVAYQQLAEEETRSWFIFPNRKLHPRNIDYLQVFSHMGIWKVTKLILMRRTVMPDGNFILLWELARGVIVFFATILYPSVLIQQAYIAYFRKYLLIMDSLTLLDIYIRLHVCYYDKRGILVTHPKLTSIYYITHSFVIDMIALIPLDLLLQFVVTVDNIESMSLYLQVEAIMRFHKLLSLYRFPCAFYYFRKDIFSPESLTQNVFKFVVYSVVLFNLVAIILLLISCNVQIENNLIVLTPAKLSWITYQNAEYSFDINSPINLYITAVYFVTGIALSVNFGDLIPSTSSEMALVISFMIIGYLFFTYVFVIISNCRANLNLNLTLYQQRMKHLIQYMKTEEIDKNLQRKAISHFEYNWQRTHGMKASVVLNTCHMALREDCVLYLYERTLCEVQIFAEQSQSFYRYLGLHLEEAYFLRDFPIIRLNDIVNTVFIIHKGAVAVQGPDGTIFEILERGSVFGNIDDVPETRSMVTVVASKAVDLIFIKTTQFYDIIRDYPVIKHKLHKCILLENLCYITTKKSKLRNIIDKDKYAEKIVNVKEKKSMLRTMQNFVCSSDIDLYMMIFSYISLMTVVHHAAFLQHKIPMFLVTYSLDVLHFIKLVAGFYTPYSDSMGDLIRDPAWIRYKYLHSWKFYVELFGLLPLEILCFISQDSSLNWLAMLRLNRCFRVFNVFYFFNKTKDYLNINIILVRLSKIFLFLIAVLHIVSSLLYMCACPFGKCDEKNWIMSANGKEKCDWYYLCSFYYVTSIVTFSAYGDLSPRSIFDLIATSIILIFAKFLVASFAGDMAAMVNSVSSALVAYDYNLKKFNIYLKKHNISANVIKKAMDYSHQLWKTNKGVQMPVILNEAPHYIVEELMTAAYGKHLTDHFVFCQCHKDFLRLLTAKLCLFTFYNGDTICHQGEVNDSMYFIHKGIVEVYAISSKEETQVDELHDLDCFGTVQGLFKDTPHTHTYISAALTVILSLKFKDWQHLLLFYPASRYEIYSKIQLI